MNDLDWADKRVASAFSTNQEGQAIAAALRYVLAVERARCLAIVRRVMDTTVTGSDAVYAVMRIAELIENGEPSPDPA